MSERKWTSTSGWVFSDGPIAITILWAGTLVVTLSAGVGPPFLTTALSYLGSCLVAFLPILGVLAVVLAKGGDEKPDVSPLVYTIPYLAAATLGAGVYYMIHNIHNMVGVPFLVFVSELLGGLVVFGGGWMVLVTILERRQERQERTTDARRLPP